MSFDEITRETVWRRTVSYQASNANGLPVQGFDAAGNEIHYRRYGDRDSLYGWEIDHILPVTNGGDDNIENLRVLHWRLNASLGGQL